MYLLSGRAGWENIWLEVMAYGVQPSYGTFINGFAKKALAGPYGSYDKSAYYEEPYLIKVCMNLKKKSKTTNLTNKP